MNESRGTFLRVGLLIVAGTVLLIGLVWFLGGTKISKGILFESYFSESVQGLEVGVAVKYRGVSVGRVTEIGLVTAEYGRETVDGVDQATYRLVFVRYIIDPKRLGRVPDTETAVKLGLRARLASAGLTGVTYIELDFVDPHRNIATKPPWQPRAEYIPSVPTTLSQVEDATRLLIERVNQIDIARLSKTIIAVLDGLDQLTHQVGDTLKTADLPSLVADLRHTSSSLRALAENSDIQRTLASSAATAEQLTRLVGQMPPLIAAVQATAKRADAGVADTQQALAPLLRDMLATVASLREVTESLRRNPAQILLGQPPPRQREQGR